MSDIKVYMIANLQIHDPKKYREYEKGFFPSFFPLSAFFTELDF